MSERSRNVQVSDVAHHNSESDHSYQWDPPRSFSPETFHRSYARVDATRRTNIAALVLLKHHSKHFIQHRKTREDCLKLLQAKSCPMKECEERIAMNDLPPEMMCNIAHRLDDTEILNLRLASSRNIVTGIDYVFAIRFFSKRILGPTNEKFEDLQRVLNTRLGNTIRTLEIEASLLYWYDEKEQEGLGMKKWALQSSVNPSDDAGSRIAFYKDRIGDPLYRIFIRMKSLKHIVVKAPHLTLRSNVFVIFSNDGSVRQPERWERDRAAQYGFLSSVFWAIAGARLRLEGFEFRGFDDPVWSPILAPSPTVLTSLRWDYQCYALLQRLHLQYDVHMTERSTFFLSVLDYTTKLKELNIELAGEIGQFSRVSNERISFICQVTTQLLTKLAPQPPFFLTHLELKGICANGEVTMDQVVRAHTSTLRILRLDDFWFLLPNSLRTFFEALANADVEYIGLRHFILANGRYLAQAVFWWLPTVWDLELEWEEEEYTMTDIGMNFDGNNKKYEDEYCGQEDDETVEGRLKEKSVKKKVLANDNVANKILAAKDETFKDWVDFKYEKRGIDAWVEYGYAGNKRGTVKRAMREMVTSIDGGWLRL